MKRAQIFILITAVVTLFQSCRKLIGEGPVVTETRAMANFTGVQLKLHAKLYYTEGAVHKVELQSQQNILNEIETIMSGNDLVIRFRHTNTNLKSGEDIIIKITAPAVSKLEVHSSGDILSESPFAPLSLRLAVSGSGNIRIHNVEANFLDGEISGSGKIDMIEGLAESQALKISGSGDMDFGNFIAKRATARISGSGSMKINVAETLDANISGSGSVRYKGNPAVTSSVSGSGSVVRW